jgi:high-affinity iron transporter
VEFGALTAGFVTGLREGVEAALIVAILLAYLNRSGNGAQASKIWLGTGLAALLSVAAGVVIFQTAGSLEPPYEQYFEATALLIAAAVVTWMLFWMLRQSKALRGELHARIERTLTEGTAMGLALLAFSAVIREGLETSIFLVGQATSVRADASSIVLGALLGLGAAVGIGWIFYTGSRRIDLRSFFRWTGIGLIFIAAGLLSQAIHELVEVGAIPFGSATAYDLSSVLPDASGIGQFLRAILGYSAAPETTTLGVHIAYLVVVLGLYLRPTRPAQPPQSPAKATDPAAASEVARS